MKNIAAPFALIMFLSLMSNTAMADKLILPSGMGGVPDIGAIPCDVFNKMIVPGPLGTKRLLLTWAQGQYHSKTGKTFDEILGDAAAAGQHWNFDSLTGHLTEFCAANPEALTSAAVADLGKKLL